MKPISYGYSCFRTTDVFLWQRAARSFRFSNCELKTCCCDFENNKSSRRRLDYLQTKYNKNICRIQHGRVLFRQRQKSKSLHHGFRFPSLTAISHLFWYFLFAKYMIISHNCIIFSKFMAVIIYQIEGYTWIIWYWLGLTVNIQTFLYDSVV